MKFHIKTEIFSKEQRKGSYNPIENVAEGNGVLAFQHVFKQINTNLYFVSVLELIHKILRGKMLEKPVVRFASLPTF